MRDRSPFQTPEFLSLSLHDKAALIMSPTGAVAEWLSGYNVESWASPFMAFSKRRDVRELKWLARILIWSLGCGCYKPYRIVDKNTGEETIEYRRTKDHEQDCSWKRLPVLREQRVVAIRGREQGMEAVEVPI